MTELETRLFKALRRLSEQYERERKLDAEQVAGLQGQLSALDGVVSGLVEDYRELVANYRRIVNALEKL